MLQRCLSVITQDTWQTLTNKVWLEAEETYTFVLDGLEGMSDYDLAIYNETGQLVNYG